MLMPFGLAVVRRTTIERLSNNYDSNFPIQAYASLGDRLDNIDKYLGEFIVQLQIYL